MAPGAQNQQQPTKNFSGNGVSVAAMCAESSSPNVAYLLSRTARLSPVKKGCASVAM